MKWAVLSDIHANAKALRAVLAAVRDDGCGKILCLGDVVGYGSDPAEAVTLVRANCDATILGNHDAAVAGRMWTDDFVDRANDSASSHRQQLDADAVAWLKALPYVFEGPGFACAHGDFARPERFDYVSEAEDAVPSWNARPEPLLFVGHTHVAKIHVVGASGNPHRMVPQDFTVEDGKRYVVNPGSVGWPRDGSHRASWAEYDDANRTVVFRSLDLDALPNEDAPSAGETAASEAPVSPARPGMARWLLVGAALVAVAGAAAFCLLARGGETVVSDGAPAVSSAVGARLWGDVAKSAKCTVPAGTKNVAFEVKLAKKSPKAFVRVVFMDANGADMASGVKWWQDVARSKKGKAPAPDGATAVRVEACAVRPGEPAPVVDVLAVHR